MDDFLYICDDAYKREELIAMEISILQTLKFDINIPIPYRFLRRFAKVRAWPLPRSVEGRSVWEITVTEPQWVGV